VAMPHCMQERGLRDETIKVSWLCPSNVMPHFRTGVLQRGQCMLSMMWIHTSQNKLAPSNPLASDI
jgi:hypothetical protein